ncbi:MAG: lipopolysaccharide heptosyltransferase II [Verrucomicrobiota bacterium]
MNSDDPQRILVRGVNWIGDAVMTTPALLRLRERFPGAHITLFTPQKLKDLWAHHPAVNEVLSLPNGKSPLAVGRKLAEGRYDLALVLPNSPRSALEVFLARIPRRIGYARPWRNFLLTTAVPHRPGAAAMRKKTTREIRRLITPDSPAAAPAPAGPGVHQIHDYLHLTAALGASPNPLPPHLAVTPWEIDQALHKFNLTVAAAGHRPLFGLCPGAEYGPAKRWPAERFISVALEIHKRTGCVWLILGGIGDFELANRIESRLRTPESTIRSLAGQTSLRELCALLKRCQLLLTNDTGPMHIAAALGTPVIAPFGSTSPALTGPGLPGDPKHRLIQSTAICAPCFLRECPIDFRCMNTLTADTVIQAVQNVVDRPS